jgi:hypothetical protein
MMRKADLDKIVPSKFGIERLPDELQQEMLVNMGLTKKPPSSFSSI